MIVARILGWLVLGVTTVMAIALSVLLLAPTAYTGLLQYAVHSATGYEIEIADLQVDLFPPRFASKDVRVTNPNRPTEQPLLTLDQFEAKANPGRYISSEPTWWSAAASGGALRVENGRNGEGNWGQTRVQSSHSKDEPQPASKPGNNRTMGQTSLFRFSAIAVSDLEITRAVDGDVLIVEVSELHVAKESDERLRVSLEGEVDGQPLRASGTLALPSSEKARDVDFHASLFGSEVALEGTVGSDGVIPGKANFSVQVQDAKVLGRVLDRDLNNFAPIDLKGSLSAPEHGRWILTADGQIGGQDLSLDTRVDSDGPNYKVDEFALEFGASSMTGQGSVNTTEQALHGKLRAKVLAIDEIVAFFESDQDAQKPKEETATAAHIGRLRQWEVDLDVDLAEVRYGSYQAQDLMIKIDSDVAGLSAAVQLGALSAQATMAINPDATSATAALDSAGGAMAADGNAEQSRFAWRLVTPLNAEARLDFEQQSDGGGWPFTGRFQTRGVEGEIDSVLVVGEKALPPSHLTLRIENFSALAGIDTERWEALLPVGIDVQARSNDSVLQLDPLALTINGSEIDGQIAIDPSQSPLSIMGDLHSQQIDVNNFSTTSLDPVEGADEDIDAASGDIIGDEPIDWGVLQAATVALRLTVDSLRFNQTIFRDVRTELALRDGKLDIDPFDANLSMGKIRGYARVTQLEVGANIEGHLMVTGLIPADIGQENTGLIDGGSTDFLVDMRATGDTPQQLASSLTGEIALEIQRATVRNNLFEIIGSDILTQTVNLLNPFTDNDDSTELECAAVYFKADQGVLTSPNQLVIETGKIKIRGGGEVNLRDETLQIDFVPTPREGLGISLGNLASVVRLGGTLGNPQPEADPSGIFKAGATIGAAIATGGLSILGQGLFDRMRSAGTACGKIFEKLPETNS